MHNKNENFTDLSESNWSVLCHTCHRHLHSKYKKYLVDRKIRMEA